MERMTGLKNFGVYLHKLFTIDAVFLNEDRHTHNIADFDEQLNISEGLYGENIEFNFTQKDVRELLENVTEYTKEEKDRVERIVCAQMNKYGYLFKK